METQTNRQMNQMSGGRRPGFTPKQGQYLAFIDAYTRLHRRPPAEREMQRHFGVTPPSVHQMILTLERAGFIRRQPGVPLHRPGQSHVQFRLPADRYRPVEGRVVLAFFTH